MPVDIYFLRPAHRLRRVARSSVFYGFFTRGKPLFLREEKIHNSFFAKPLEKGYKI